MTKLFLYHCPRACSRVTMNALEETGLDYDDRAIDIYQGENKSAEYLKIHPGGKVPALVVDDIALTENAAILIFLNSLKPEANLLPSTDSPFEQAKLYADLIWCSGTMHPMIRQIRMPLRYSDGELSGIYAKGIEYLNALLPQIEARIGNDEWWYGNQWSIVDVYLHWCYSTAASAKFSLEPFPIIQAHAERVVERASFKRAHARELVAFEKAGMETPKFSSNVPNS